MTDRRFLRANAHVAHRSQAGDTDAPRLTDGTTRSVTAPHADLCASPNGPRDKQLLFGNIFVVLDVQDGWAFGFDRVDDYVGYVHADALGPAIAPTHRLWTRLSHIYSAPDLKSPEGFGLSFFSELALGPQTGAFFEVTGHGYIPHQHVAPLDRRDNDPAAIAERFLGTPYLWGGNTGTGIDCSGLVQLALCASGRACPRDSDMQQSAFPHINPNERQRGDLVFWKGHVGMLLDPDTLIHANAHHMAVAIEPLAQAIARIAQKEFGDVTGYARP